MRNLLLSGVVSSAALFLTGCAVMEIDVDVYKGPLANEEDVKTEQYAAMAIGAKPILVQLRDRLEWGDENDKNDNILAARESPCYRPEFMMAIDNLRSGYWTEEQKSECNNTSRFMLRTGPAIRVNNILYLYENREKAEDPKKKVQRTDEEAERLDIQGLDGHRAASNDAELFQTEAFLDWQQILDPTTPEAQSVAETIRPFIKPLDAAIANLKDDDFKNLLGAGEIKSQSDLLGLLNNPEKSPDGALLAKAYSFLLEGVVWGSRTIPIPDPTPLGYLLNRADKYTYENNIRRWKPLAGYSSELNWNALFGSLRDAERASWHARLIFGANENAYVDRERFVQRVTDIGFAYHQSRRSMYNLWEDTIFTLQDFPDMDDSDVEQLTTLVTRFTQPVTLSAAYCQLGKQTRIDGLYNWTGDEIAILRNRVEDLFTGSVLLETTKLNGAGESPPDWNSGDFNSARNLIANRLKDRNWRQETLSVLLGVDSFFLSLQGELDENCKIYYGGIDVYKSSVGRKYGLVTSPFSLNLATNTVQSSNNNDPSQNARESDIESLDVDLEAVVGVKSGYITTGGSLAEGRLDDGLEILIEEFLNARTEPDYLDDNHSKKVDNARKILNGALLRFSEKLLFIANHAVLLSDNMGKDGNARAVKNENDNELDKDSLTLVLQAIGNAIQVLGDELAMKQRYDQESENAAVIENDTIDLIWQADCSPTCPSKTTNKITKVDLSVDTPITQAILDPAENGDETTAQEKSTKDKKNISTDKRESANTNSQLVSVNVTSNSYSQSVKNDRAKTQLRAFDRVIASLRHTLLKLTAQGENTANKAQIKGIEKALKLAYEQRAGMAYIRSAAIYLRSSYAATSLQEGNDVLWRNKLAEHAGAGIPLIGPSIANSEQEKERAKVIGEIDKQFWQTINNVTVRGAGTTNYVIAKDDIGNWYVKGFDADPSDITKAAFALGTAQLGVGVTQNQLRGFDPGNPAPEEQPARDNSPIAIKFEQDRQDMTDESIRANEALINSLSASDGVVPTVTDIWGATDDADLNPAYSDTEIRARLDNALRTVVREMQTSMQTPESGDSNPAAVYAGNLASYQGLDARFTRHLTNHGFDDMLAPRIKDARNKGDTAAETAATDLQARLGAAREEAARIIAVHVNDIAQRRIEAQLQKLSAYHNTLGVLSQTVAP